MRIGIDCRKMLHPEKGEAAGVGHYVHELVPRLLDAAPKDEFVLFFDDRDAAAAKREFLKGRKNAVVRMLPFAGFKRAMPFVYSHMVVSAAFERQKLDVLHGPANVLPLFYKRPSVVTVHDLAIYHHPKWFPRRLPGAQTFSKRIVVPHSLAAARRIIAVSEATKRDIARIFPGEAGKTAVVHEGAAIAPPTAAEAAKTLAARNLTDGKYVLTLSTIEPRKNIPGLVRGFMAAVATGNLPDDVALVIAGAKGWLSEKSMKALREAVWRLGRPRVRLLGYLPAAQKAAIIAGAGAFVYPSFYEGFGLPPLEAMALGVPTIVSMSSSLPEVCGDAAIYVHPKDADGIGEAIVRVFSDRMLAADMAEKGRKQAEKFTWEKAAAGTLACYRAAAAA
jgi:glycosyltransferase involved in cell wall biosynthesis